MKPDPLKDIEFLFFTEQGKLFQNNTDKVDELLEKLRCIDSFLNQHECAKKFKAKLGKTKNIQELLAPLNFYAQHSLEICKQDKDKAYEKFVDDLCVSNARVSMQILSGLSKFPPYKISDLFLEGIRDANKESPLNALGNERYAYFFKTFVAACTFYLEVSANWSTAVPCSVLMMLNEMIECPDHPHLQAALKEIIPLGIWMGMNIAMSDAPLGSVSAYATMSYGFLRISQAICRKMVGSTSFLGQYFQPIMVQFGSLYLFQRYFPANEWMTHTTSYLFSDPNNCFNNPTAKTAAANYLNLPLEVIEKSLHDFALGNYVPGKVVDPMEALAYQCLRM